MTQVQVDLFGQLTDITGHSPLMLENIPDTDALVRAINALYPAMQGVRYTIAIDKKTIQSNTLLHETARVALLPPFSGG